MEAALKQLKSILAEISDINSAASLLGWDQETYMPKNSAEARGYQMGTLNSMAHKLFTGAQVGHLLDTLEPFTANLDPDSADVRLIQVTRRDYEKKLKVPPELVAELDLLSSLGHQAWAEARAENDFSRFSPHLEKLVDNRRRYAELFAPHAHVYDPLLDDYEPGMTTQDVQRIFNGLRTQQVALIKEIAQQPQVDDAFLYVDYDTEKQWEISVEVATLQGYDWTRGRMDKALHPFTSGFSIDDVRITTRVLPNILTSALFSTMHETGHALYELGFDRAFRRSPLESSASMAVHESQSRLWENQVGRSFAFWEYYYPRLQAHFPDELGSVPLETFYKAVNRVQPSLIRVEADEATYNLHIMLRLELEIAMLEGSLAIKDLPEAWNTRMQDYLGLTPPTDSVGVLQDVHWSEGLIGYFPTYALGNLISAQLWECLHQDIPDLQDQIRQGEFQALLGWLRQKIHVHGRKFRPQELVQRVTGSQIDPAPYLRYLRSKYSQIYHL